MNKCCPGHARAAGREGADPGAGRSGEGLAARPGPDTAAGRHGAGHVRHRGEGRPARQGLQGPATEVP